MEGITITLFVSALILASLGLCYLDSRYDLRLVDWVNGQCKNPFSHSKAMNVDMNKDSQAEKQTIAELKERIATLEKIVTEPAYELNQKINRL